MAVSALTARLQVIEKIDAKMKDLDVQLDSEYDRMYDLEELVDTKTNSDECTEEDCNQTEVQYNECCQGITTLEQQLQELKEERERLFIADDDAPATMKSIAESPVSAARPAPPPPRPLARSSSSSSNSMRGGGDGPVAPPRRISSDGASGPTPSPRGSPEKKLSSDDKRARIVEELINTEGSFGADLRVVEATYLKDNGMEEHGIDKETLFGNIVHIAAISERILAALKEEGLKQAEDQEIGRMFLNLSDEIESTYVTYCVNYEAANILLNAEYAKDDGKQAYFVERHRRLSESSAAWDLNSCLIKPVQRIMKYPMLLKEMQASTNPGHPDAANLGLASDAMAAVAKVINERKRTKELLKRYIDSDAANQSSSSSKSVGGKLLHAFSKKGGRLTERIRGQLSRSASAGGEDSEEAVEHRQYATNVKNAQTLDSSAQTLKKCIQKHADQLKASTKCFLDCGTKLVAVYEKDDLADEAALVKGSICGIHAVTEVYVASLTHKVYDPLSSFHGVFANPFKLIAKCEDKRLDFERIKRKYKAAEKDPEKRRLIKADLDLAESTFKALYQQLNQELPKFLELADAFFVRVLDALLKARLTLTKACVAELEPCFHFVRADPAGSVQEIRSTHDAKLRVAAESLVKTSHVVPMVFAKEFRFEDYVSERPPRVPAAALSDRVSMRRSVDGSADPAPWDRRRSSIGKSSSGDFFDSLSVDQQPDDAAPAPSPPPPRAPAPPAPTARGAGADEDSSSHCLCLYDFEAESHFELTIFEGETVRILSLTDPTGNPDWVHIQNEQGAKGYVPKGFLEL